MSANPPSYRHTYTHLHTNRQDRSLYVLGPLVETVTLCICPLGSAVSVNLNVWLVVLQTGRL